MRNRDPVLPASVRWQYDYQHKMLGPWGPPLPTPILQNLRQRMDTAKKLGPIDQTTSEKPLSEWGANIFTATAPPRAIISSPPAIMCFRSSTCIPLSTHLPQGNTRVVLASARHFNG
ncbi:hypothetical protein ACLOJK_010384 [Asimina triloba]